jgi:hypothetical protein
MKAYSIEKDKTGNNLQIAVVYVFQAANTKHQGYPERQEN